MLLHKSPKQWAPSMKPQWTIFSSFWRFWHWNPILPLENYIPLNFQQIWSIFNFPAFLQFLWQQSTFWKFWHWNPVLHLNNSIPINFKQVWSIFSFPAFFSFHGKGGHSENYKTPQHKNTWSFIILWSSLRLVLRFRETGQKKLRGKKMKE